MGLLQERRPCSWLNAIWAMPFCEGSSSCRGPRAHHAQTDRVGTWESSRLTDSLSGWRSASGRRGAVADDARTREVGLRHSSCEAGEQSGAACRGAGGAKGGDQGKCEPADHVPGAAPDKRATDAGAHTESREGKEEGEVHDALTPHQP